MQEDWDAIQKKMIQKLFHSGAMPEGKSKYGKIRHLYERLCGG